MANFSLTSTTVLVLFVLDSQQQHSPMVVIYLKLEPFAKQEMVISVLAQATVSD